MFFTIPHEFLIKWIISGLKTGVEPFGKKEAPEKGRQDI